MRVCSGETALGRSGSTWMYLTCCNALTWFHLLQSITCCRDGAKAGSQKIEGLNLDCQTTRGQERWGPSSRQVKKLFLYMLLVCFCRHKRRVLSQGSYLIIVCVRAGVLPHARADIYIYILWLYIYMSYNMSWHFMVCVGVGVCMSWLLVPALSSPRNLAARTGRACSST